MKLSAPIFRLKRRAKLLSRENAVPLSEALNSIAKQEGFQSWSQLAARHARSSPATKILSALIPGDLVLLGARPGHGKTLMGLELILQSVKSGNHAAFYSLEYTKREIDERLSALGATISASNDVVPFDTSDEICANYIVRQLSSAPRGTVVVIDYLQILDQKRANPMLAAQIAVLKDFADMAGLIVILISQIDRSYDPGIKSLPDLADVRLPNPLDLNLFTKTIFLNEGAVQFQAVA
jgi:replicative DNA helicase